MVGEGAYRGLRVLDLGQGVAAPYCAMLLAMHGAEVIKIEPLAGDWSRGLGRRYGDQTAMSAHYNRGKRSLALDLKDAAARYRGDARDPRRHRDRELPSQCGCPAGTRL